MTCQCHVTKDSVPSYSNQQGRDLRRSDVTESDFRRSGYYLVHVA